MHRKKPKAVTRPSPQDSALVRPGMDWAKPKARVQVNNKRMITQLKSILMGMPRMRNNRQRVVNISATSFQPGHGVVFLSSDPLWYRFILEKQDRRHRFAGSGAVADGEVSLPGTGFLTMRTGQGVWRKTFSATLPMSTRPKPVRPCVPMIM